MYHSRERSESGNKKWKTAAIAGVCFAAALLCSSPVYAQTDDRYYFEGLFENAGSLDAAEKAGQPGAATGQRIKAGNYYFIQGTSAGLSSRDKLRYLQNSYEIFRRTMAGGPCERQGYRASGLRSDRSCRRSKQS